MNGDAWDGLGNFALATGIYATPGGSGTAFAVKRGDTDGILAAAARSMVGFDDREDDPARETAAATVKAVSALIDTGAGVAGPTGADARPAPPDTGELIRRFRRRFGATAAHAADSPRTRFRHHHVGSLPEPRSVDEGRPPPGTIGDAYHPADQ